MPRGPRAYGSAEAHRSSHSIPCSFARTARQSSSMSTPDFFQASFADRSRYTSAPMASKTSIATGSQTSGHEFPTRSSSAADPRRIVIPQIVLVWRSDCSPRAMRGRRSASATPGRASATGRPERAPACRLSPGSFPPDLSARASGHTRQPPFPWIRRSRPPLAFLPQGLEAGPHLGCHGGETERAPCEDVRVAEAAREVLLE